MGGPTPDRSVGGPRRTTLPARRAAGLATLALTLPLSGVLATSGLAATDTDAQAAAVAVMQASTVPAGWTGSTASCLAGTESPLSVDATLRAMNAYRSVAGLSAVTFDPAMNAKALEAALMMRAGNENGNDRGLDHDPAADWPCYSPLGASGAATSNLALGSSGADAIRVYVADERVPSLGHRRWILDPSTSVFGTGSTGSTNALAVLGGPRSTVPSGTQVPWPPAGAIAAAWLPSTWSVSLGGTGDAVAFTNPQVTMTLNGTPVGISGVSDLGTGYGTGRALSWVPDLSRAALDVGYHRIAVSISGATIGGVPVPIAYTTTLGTPPALPAATPLPTPTASQQATTPALPSLRPRIARPRGKLRRGTRLTASFAQGTGRIVTGVQWLRNGRPIKGATAIHYRVARNDLGRTLRVRITSQAKDGTAIATEQSDGLKIRR